MKNGRELLKKTIERTLGERKLVLVSNRGPVQFVAAGDGQIVAQRGSGGLITALHSVLTTTRALWIAAAMTPADRQVAASGKLVGVPPENPHYWMHLVDIDPEKFDLYYNQFSNRVLWFLQHYLFDALARPALEDEIKAAWTEGYVAVNRQFADAVVANTREVDDPIVMIQDYHLYMIPRFLRPQKPRAVLFHFLHVPWCSPDYLRFLPGDVRDSILRSLLENDIIGFHSWRYVRNFLHCCQEFLGCHVDQRKHRVFLGDRTVAVRAYPISISVEELRDFAESAPVRREEQPIAKLANEYQLIVRIDRAELSKNLLRGFDAYRLLLESHPELHGRVKFLALAYPTREHLPEYRAYRQQIELRVADINARFGSDGWRPIDLIIDDNYARSVGAMKHFDVLLTNPIYDGMNLVAKEACILNGKDGVIVLSENAGAFEELRDGVLGINPFDVEETKERLYEALTMEPVERRQRARRLREIVERNDVLKWLYHQLRDINRIKRPKV